MARWLGDVEVLIEAESRDVAEEVLQELVKEIDDIATPDVGNGWLGVVSAKVTPVQGTEPGGLPGWPRRRGRSKRLGASKGKFRVGDEDEQT